MEVIWILNDIATVELTYPEPHYIGIFCNVSK